MAEYIEKGELIAWLMPYVHTGEKVDPEALFTDIVVMKGAEVAPVVRCRDCRWRGREECAMFYRCDCGEQHTWETDDDFCSYGEHKED